MPREPTVTVAEPPRAPGRPAAPRATPRREDEAGDAASFWTGGKERTRAACAPGFHVGSSGTRATPADHTDTLHPSGVHIALLTEPLGVVGVCPGAP